MNSSDKPEPSPAEDPDLPPEVKNRIVLEERYRSEVKDQLGSYSPRRNKLIAFLNTSLGIWLLSTLVVSGLGALYTQTQQNFERRRGLEQDRRRQNEERAFTVSKLDLEISYRLANLLAYLNEKHLEQIGRLAKGGEVEQIQPHRLSLMLQVPPESAVQYNYPSLSLFHENRSKTVTNLLADLSLLVPQSADDDQEARDVATSLARLSDLTEFFQVEKLLRRPDNAEIVASAIQQKVFLPRWRQSQFFYTDCNAKVPFC